MASGWSINFSFLLLLLFAEAKIARKMMTDGKSEEDNHLLIPKHKGKDQMDDPSLSVFFKVDHFNVGTKLPIYFSKKDFSVLPPLLSRKEADSIPFCPSDLPFLLRFFSIPEDSPQAEAMAQTLEKCSLEAVKNEIKFCATSLESMLDSVRETLGSNSGLKILSTKFVSKTSNFSLQNYTISERPKELFGKKMLGCHSMPYPYAVYYCHGHRSGSRAFEVSLVGENDGERVVGPAFCHMDTSTWEEDHVAFRLLGMKPGSAPVCHFFPLDNLAWVKM